ncbi:ATP-binding protein [Lacimicrobium alkaliphilum]|uniref:Schlafen AlbA-2 domain-containing protein n=1 Tax=Lacimicrobium alkaliphilum TaxID=1526571 RepID=A0ABQ1RRW7_9ALTE|nr:ATP-binding protein [Lacimicrobium alkaliphilum]GGD79332.1 hypothetical protein GCM10011357_37910 [Lacimicrobium alkaliphilum]
MSSEHSLWQEIQQGESKTLEFKQQLPKGEQLAKTLIAFANTSGGKLILGVNDLRQVLGVKEDEFDLMDQIASMAHDHCHPTLMPNIHLETVQGKTLVIVQVYRGSQLPYYLKSKGREKGTHVRLSATNRLRKLCQQAGNPEPTIKETGDFVDIEFHRTVSTDDVEGSEKSSEKTPSLLALIQRDPRISARSLAEELGVSSRAIEKQIAQLKQQGKLDRIGPAKGGYWKVKG